jgi:uncharacterized spore protein YtfJ
VIKKAILALAVLLLLLAPALGQTQAEKKPATPVIPPASQLADEMAARLAGDLHVKTIVGEPLKVGSVTLIPILMIDVSFGGGGMASPAQSPAPGVDGFIASGDARPLGFVAITRKGVRFISVGKTPAK